MNRIDIDFVERRAWRLPGSLRQRGWLFALAAAVLLAGFALADQGWELDRESAETAQAIARARRAIAAATPRPSPPLLLSEAQVVAVNKVVAELNTPWPAILDGFENVASSEVALLQIEPDRRRRLVKGVAEAKNAQQMVDYLAALGTTRPFTDAMVTRQEVNEKDPNRPLRFMFEARLEDSPALAAPPPSQDGE